ncbi:kiwellin-like [Arachis duranensis]|uniref:Kiwellin-like n=1 Tax=Arachis duranensis TaxID=130453 RepID=A0A6P5MK77_ARADU|nr:kiwellin-like [Arachis duranensis]
MLAICASLGLLLPRSKAQVIPFSLGGLTIHCLFNPFFAAIAAKINNLFLLCIFLFNLLNVSFLINGISYCYGPCNDFNDCDGQLICTNGKCNDDPDLGTHICRSPPPPRDHGSPPPPSGGSGTTCRSSGTLQCGTNSYPQYTCSPPVSSSTKAILTLNGFSEGGDGGAPSECDDQYHQNSEPVVALSTGWFNKVALCLRYITITSTRTGRSVRAKVVDECDSVHGCDEEHAGQPPCRNNIVDGSQAVWDALGLDSNVGEENVTWATA